MPGVPWLAACTGALCLSNRYNPMNNLTLVALGSLLCIACRSTHQPIPAQSEVHPAGSDSVETFATEGPMDAALDLGDAPSVEASQAQADAEYQRLIDTEHQGVVAATTEAQNPALPPNPLEASSFRNATEAIYPKPGSTIPASASSASFDPDALEALMSELATPGEEHRWLGQLTGTWKADVQYWVLPGTEPAHSKGTLHTVWSLGERFLQLDYRGSVMGQPFQGFGHIGYDKVRGQFVGYWVDSTGTQMMNVATGVRSRDQKTLTLRRRALDPLSGLERDMKETLTIQGPDELQWQLWGYAPDGTYFRMARIVYRRAKG